MLVLTITFHWEAQSLISLLKARRTIKIVQQYDSYLSDSKADRSKQKKLFAKWSQVRAAFRVALVIQSKFSYRDFWNFHVAAITFQSKFTLRYA